MDVISSISAEFLQNIGLGLLTLIVPIGIYILEDGKGLNYSELDRNIKIHFIDGRNFLIELSWVLLPLVFWNSVGPIIKLVMFFVWMGGIVLITKRVVKIYTKWVTLNDSEKDKSRIEVLSKNHFQENRLVSSWASVWSSKNLNITSEREFFNVFSKKIDECLKKANKECLGLASTLLRDFNSNFENRDVIFAVVFKDFFSKILEWHKKAWECEYNLLGDKDDIDLWAGYSEFSDQLGILIRATVEKSLKGRYSFSLFSSLKSHLDKYGNEKISKNEKDYYYLNNLTIFRELLEKIPEASESYDIWHHYFPADWKITEDNIKKHIVSRFWWREYEIWANSKINGNSEKIDNQLEQATEGLFPGINSITWSIILTFACRSWSGDRVEDLIKQRRNFGFSVLGDGNYPYSEDTYWENFWKEIEQKEDYTVKLACFLLKGSFREIDQHIEKLEELKYEDKYEEDYRKEILRIFKKIQINLKTIIFIFGPSGVGKSYLSSLMEKQNFQFVHIDTDDKKRAFASYGYDSEWDKDFSKVDFDIFLEKLRDRLKTEHKGVVVSFPTTYRLTKEKLDYLRKIQVIPILLWGDEKYCKQSAEKRINKKGMQFNLGRYDQKNLQTFHLYGRPEYDFFRLEAFRVDGSRFSDEELKKQISGYISKLSN